MKKLLLAAILTAIMAMAGTAIAEDAAEAPYFVIEAQTIGMDIVGLVPDGLRVVTHARGAVTDGLFVGSTVTGTDYLVFRHDGVGVIDARWLVEDPSGVAVAIAFQGFIGEPMPGLLEAMLDPEAEPLDVDIPVHGAAWFQTMAPQYASLNYTVFAFTGAVNIAEGGLQVTFRSLAPWWH